jgi:hypothetical protein
MCRRSEPFRELVPTPGPGDYSPNEHTPYTPAFSMRLKLRKELVADGNPGPGQYDVAESTIGNWGAGMAALLPPQEDTFLAERTAMFAQTCKMPIQSKELRECMRRQKVVVPRKCYGPRTRGGPAARPCSEPGAGAASACRLQAMEALYLNDL